MRVLYLTINPNRASTTVPTEGWFRLLRPRGLDPVLVSSQSGAFQRWAADAGIPTLEMPLPFPSKTQPAAFLRSLWRLRALIREHRIQLVHCNEQDVYPIGQFAARLTGIPVVVSVHFTMEPGFCRWAFSGRRQPARMFFVSEGNREACRQGVTGVVPERAWRVLPNGINLSHFRVDETLREQTRQQLGLPAGPVLGVACALRPRKQLEHLFDSVAAMRDVPTVVVAGGPVPGDEAYAASLIAEGTRKLGSHLHVLGHLDELRGFYNAIDVFVNTSQEEACSISVIEALACGCPVVGYASKSVDGQILPHGGEIVPQDDVVALSRALSRWVADPERLWRARAGARRQAENLFDADALANALWAEYESVL